jgi:hypothetical protein
MIERADLAHRQREYRRGLKRRDRVLGACFFACLIGIIPVFAFTNRVVAAVLLALWLVTLVSFQVPYLMWERRLVKQYGLRCESCGFDFTGASGMVVLAAGRCGNCGVKVVAEAGDEKGGERVSVLPSPRTTASGDMDLVSGGG